MTQNILICILILCLAQSAANCRERTRTNIYPRLPLREGSILLERPDGHIINGNPADPHEYPWQVGLYIDTYYFCGGTLIARNWVLTAAHCLQGFNEVEVIFGAVDIKEEEDCQSCVFAKRLIPHEEFDPYWFDYDIGLLELPFKILFNDYVFSIPLTRIQPPVGSDVILTGWGMQNDNNHGLDDLADDLMELDTVIIENNICKKYFLHPHWEQNTCLDGTGGIGSCSGDSGGPMVFNLEGQMVLGGVCSFGSPSSCEHGAPSVYSNVYYYLDWIEEQTGLTFD